MAPRKTRKLSLDDEEDQPESDMAARTRPRHELEPINHNIPLPPSPSPSPWQPDLNLSLLHRPPEPPHAPPQLPPPPPPPPANFFPGNAPQPHRQPQGQRVAAPAQRRNRKNPTQAPRPGKPLTIPPPFPWATDHRATVDNLSNLLEKGIKTIFGDVQCKHCEQQYRIEYDLQDKFSQLAKYVAQNKYIFHDRAPSSWMDPSLPSCKFCDQENSVKPVMAEKKKSINWLFLLLGQMLGCCTLEQLKYFCKHTKNHRTGAKNRVLFLTYLGLCKQLDPTGPFDRS